MAALNLKIYGIVQGVGFRPFVSRLANKLGLKGTVANKGSYVEVIVCGEKNVLDEFCKKLPQLAPERSAILKIAAQEITTPLEFADFSIIDSEKDAGIVFVSPDIATCQKCQKDYSTKIIAATCTPSLIATACGPRLTILESMPYDRERTTMKKFPLCDACRAEYESETDRRYDAQPVCCPDCGPHLFILGKTNIKDAAAITETRKNNRPRRHSGHKGYRRFSSRL